MVIKCLPGLDQITDLGERGIRFGCGVLLSRAANYARDRALTGMEFAHGIPGSVGGAVLMNAGAYLGEMSQIVSGVRFLHPDGTVQEFHGEDLAFGYRKSAFEGLPGLILSADVELVGGEREAISRRMEELSEKRRDRQPLEYPSAGSSFKRPAQGYAAALIDQCGLKGMQVGGAQVSEKHAGFVINRGDATCRDVVELMGKVHAVVREQTGISLEPEVKLLGGETWNF